MKKLFTLFLVAISVGVMAQESVLLRLNYEKGTHQDIQVTMKQSMSIGMEIQTKMLLQNDVIDVKENEYVIENKTKEVLVDTNYMGRLIKYDSNMPEDKMDLEQKGVHAKIKPIINSSILFTYDSLGKILDSKLKSGNADLESLKQNAPAALVYPKEQVKEGSTWTIEEKKSTGLEVKNTYTVTKIDKEVVYLKMSGVISGLAEGKMSGEIMINKKTGLLMSSKTLNTIITMGNEVKTEATITVK